MIAGIKYRLRLIRYYNDIVKELYGKSKVVDMLMSRIFLHAPYQHYVVLCFYKKPWKNRKNYIMDNDIDYSFKYNPGVTENSTIDKGDIVKKTIKYMKRKVVFTKKLSFSEFKTFAESLKSFFYKPIHGYGGKCIEKFNLKGISSLNELYDKIKSMPDGLLEETIEQNKEMNRLCPTVLQTIRFLVFKHKDGPKILFASIRTSINKTAVVDNASAGGVFANINLDTGQIQTNAFRAISDFEDIEKYDINLFNENGLEKHPITGVPFKGFKIPCFEEAKQMVIDITNDVDFYKRRLLGFDIAISEKGPVLVEANINRPGFGALWQTSCKDIPLKPVLDKMLKE